MMKTLAQISLDYCNALKEAADLALKSQREDQMRIDIENQIPQQTPEAIYKVYQQVSSKIH